MNFAWVAAAVAGIAAGNIVKRITGKYMNLGGRGRIWQTKADFDRTVGSKVRYINGLLYGLIAAVHGINPESGVYCLMASALLILAFTDWNSYLIPPEINLFLFGLGLAHLVLDWGEWPSYLLGAAGVGIPLWIVFEISKGRSLGGGDVKLMAAVGLLLGFWRGTFTFLIACMAAAFIQMLCLSAGRKEKIIALGPYLAVSTLFMALWGEICLSYFREMMRWAFCEKFFML